MNNTRKHVILSYKIGVLEKKTRAEPYMIEIKMYALEANLIFGSFGLSTKGPYTIMLCPSSLSLVS